MNVWADRVADATFDTAELTERLTDAAPEWATDEQIAEALVFVAIQCDVDEDDYETMEAVFLARIADADRTGER